MYKANERCWIPGIGSRWLCIKAFILYSDDNIRYVSGKVYKSEGDGTITDDYGANLYWSSDSNIYNLFEYFKPIPKNKRCCLQRIK